LIVVLDAWAVIALPRDEPGADEVERMIAGGEAVMSASRVQAVRQTVRIEQPDWPPVERAAGVKAEGGISYAHAFCVATALRAGAPIATGDPEILALKEIVSIDLRRDR